MRVSASEDGGAGEGGSSNALSPLLYRLVWRRIAWAPICAR